MQRGLINELIKRGLALALAGAVFMQSSVTGYAAANQGAVTGETIVVEETEAITAKGSDEVQLVVGETTVEETTEAEMEETTVEESIEAETATVEEITEVETEETTVEETAEAETEEIEEESIGAVIEEESTVEDVFAQSAEADFVIDDKGVLTKYVGEGIEIEIPEGVTEIKGYVFRDRDIVSVSCPDSLKKIGEGAFMGCASLAEVDLNEGLQTIEVFAFKKVGFGSKDVDTNEVTGVSLIIPSTVQKIGGYAFEECKYLEEVTFSDGTNKVLTVDSGATFANCSKLKKVVLPDRMTQVVNSMFLGCSALEEITFGTKLEQIGDNAFKDCTVLAGAEFPEGLTTIGDYAFKGAAFGKLNESTNEMEGTILEIPSTVQEIGVYAFEQCKYIEEIIFQNGTNGVLNLGYGIFSGCGNVKKAVLPDRMTKVTNYMFKDCKSLETVTFGTELKEIGEQAFKDCPVLAGAEFPEGLTTIGDYAFKGAAFGKLNESTNEMEGTTLEIPSTVQEIGVYAFEQCKYIEEIIFQNGTNGVLNLEYGIFGGCGNVKKAVLPDRMTKVSNNMFKDCKSLETVTFGTKLKEIGEQAFRSCTALKSVTTPSTLETIGESAFANCSELGKVTLNEGLKTIEAYAFSNVGFGSKDITTNMIKGETLVIPSTVQKIEVYAFSSCKYLQEVIFENGLNKVFELGNGFFGYVFLDCKNLKKVLLPDRLKNMLDYTFLDCASLTTFYIPETVEKINDEAVRNCNKSLVIYGVPGSAAQTYANKKGYTFKNCSELGLFATDIYLNRSKIEVSGETAKGKTFTLKATVKPSTAQNKKVKYQSQDENVAVVDEKGVVTITGYGSTEIKATSVENDSITTSCRVIVLKEWTDEEKNSVSQFIKDNNELNVLTNIYDNLQDIKLKAPEGMTALWRLPYEIGTGVKSYDVILQQDGYKDAVLEDIEVTGITVTGIKFNCDNLVQSEKSSVASVEVITEGGNISANDYIVTYKSSKSSNVEVSADASDKLKASVTGIKKGTNANITARVSLKLPNGLYSDKKTDKGITWFEVSNKVTVANYVIVDDIDISVSKDDDTGLSSLENIVNLDGKEEYILTAESISNNEKISSVPLTWKSSNTSVATIKAQKDGTVKLTVSAKGTTVISVTAAKNGGYTESFRVSVKDSKPRLVEKNIAINLYKTDASGYVQIIPSDGCNVSKDSLSVVTSKGEESVFDITYAGGNTYKISVKASEKEKLTSGTQSVKILAKTSAEETVSHELALKIKVEKKAPAVKLVQTAINLYEKEGRGQIQIVTDAEIDDISYTPGKNTVAHLAEAETDIENGILKVKAIGADKSTYSGTANKGTLKITFVGYEAEATYKKSVTLSVNKKLPVFTAVPVSGTLYPETLADTTEITLLNKTTGENIFSSDKYKISQKVPNGYTYEEHAMDRLPRITALKAARGANVEYIISSEQWIEGVTVPAKCTLKIGKTPVLSFAPSKVTFNTAYTVGDYEAVAIDAYVKGFENLKLTSIDVTGKDAKSAQVLKEGALTFFLEDGILKGGITDSSYFTKAGNYKFIVTAYADGKTVSGTLNVAVALPKSKPVVSFKTKGSINLLDRENTKVIATPTIKNYTGKVVNADLYGAHADKFRAQVENGVVNITALEEHLKEKTNYTLNVHITLDSGVKLASTIKVTPKQVNPKLVQNTKEIVLFETAPGAEFGKKFNVSLADKQAGSIKDIKLVTNTDTFEFDAATGNVYVKDKPLTKPGKKYTLKFEVIFDDAAVNAKPVTVSLKVDYRK